MQAYDGSDNYSRLQRDTGAAPTEAEASGAAKMAGTVRSTVCMHRKAISKYIFIHHIYTYTYIYIYLFIIYVYIYIVSIYIISYNICKYMCIYVYKQIFICCICVYVNTSLIDYLILSDTYVCVRTQNGPGPGGGDGWPAAEGSSRSADCGQQVPVGWRRTASSGH